MLVCVICVTNVWDIYFLMFVICIYGKEFVVGDLIESAKSIKILNLKWHKVLEALNGRKVYPRIFAKMVLACMLCFYAYRLLRLNMEQALAELRNNHDAKLPVLWMCSKLISIYPPRMRVPGERHTLVLRVVRDEFAKIFPHLSREHRDTAVKGT